MEEIDPIKQQAVKDALEFCACRNNADMSDELFIKLVTKIYKFYTKDGEEQQRDPVR
jgi:hypothetical protein